MAPSPRRVWLTPGVFLTILLVAECLLLCFQPIRRFAAYDHRAWPALSTMVFALGGLALLGLWYFAVRAFNRRFQFGLRALVLMVVCLAVPLAAISAQLRRVRQTRAAEIKIRKLGGTLQGAVTAKPAAVAVATTAAIVVRPARPPDWLEHLLGEDLFYRPSYDTLECTLYLFTDDTCPLWREFPDINRLAIYNTRITDDGLRQLQAFDNLEHLVIENSPLTDRGLEHIVQGPQLVALLLRHTKITDQALSKLRLQERLVTLSLRGAPITGVGFEQLPQMTELQNLDLSFTALNDAGLAAIARTQTPVILILGGTEITDAGLAELAALTSLRKVDVRGCKVSPEAAERLSWKMSECLVLYDQPRPKLRFD